jgi:hypothetical protein
MKKCNWLGTGDDGSDAGLVKDLGDGWCENVFAAAQEITTPDGVDTFGGDRAEDAELRVVMQVGENAVPARIHASGERCAIHLRGADEGGVMIAEENSIGGQRVKGGTILGRDEVGPHAVPDHDHHVLSSAPGGLGSRSFPGGKQTKAYAQEGLK